jgi:hypothetical protein
MATALPKVNYQNTFFPSHLVDPALKDRTWHLQYAKAAYQTWSNNYLWLQRRNDWIADRKYADGNQTTQKYIDWVTRVKDEYGKKASYLNLDWSIVSTIPKIRKVVINHLLKVNYDIIATAVNPDAVEAKETAKLRTWAEKQLQPFLQQMQDQSGVPLTNPELDIIPEVREEFEMLFAMTFKMAEELKIELATQHILDKNRYEDTRRKMLEDAFDLGFAACRVDTNTQTKEIDVRYVDPVNLMYDNYRGKTGGMGDGDLERIGEFRALTISQLKMEAGNQFTDDDYQMLANTFASYYNNPYTPVNANQPYVNTDTNFNQWQNYQVVVVDIYWLSTDRMNIKRVNVDGDEMVYSKGANARLGSSSDYQDGKKIVKSVEPIDIQTVYKCSWVLNTELCYNWGKAYDIPRDKQNPRECSLPIKIYRCDNKSTLESIIPYADAMQLTWLKLQNLKTMALPKGLLINIEAWENVMVDGKIKSTQELFQMATETGIVLYRGQNTIDDGRITGKPIEEFDGGLGKQFSEMIADLDYSMRMIYEVSGINEIMAGSNPNPNMLSGVAKQAVLSSENSLGSILAAVTNNHERAATDISLKLQIMLENGTIVVYSKALGKIIEVGSEISPMTFGIALEPRPTDKQREELKQMIMSAVINPNNPNAGGMYIDDAIPLINELDSGVNLKLVMRKYSYMLQKRRKEFQAMEQQKIQTQSDGIVAQTKEAKNGQLEVLQLQHKNRLEEIRAQGEEDRKTLKEGHFQRNDQAVIKSDLKKGEKAFETTLPSK